MSVQYATKESFDVYIKYLAMKRHFSTDGYDYHKYNGKTKASFETFQTRNDVFFFYKLSKNPKHEEVMLSNFVKNQNVWIRDICDIKGEDIYLEWKKKIDSLSYTFQSDLNKLDEDYNQNFIVNKGQHPLLMSLYLQKKITLETFTIITNLSNTLGYWEENIIDKIVSGDIIRLSRKYYPFLEIDNKKFKNIVKKHFFPI